MRWPERRCWRAGASQPRDAQAGSLGCCCWLRARPGLPVWLTASWPRFTAARSSTPCCSALPCAESQSPRQSPPTSRARSASSRALRVPPAERSAMPRTRPRDRRSRSDSAQPPVACVLAWRRDRKLDAVAGPRRIRRLLHDSVGAPTPATHRTSVALDADLRISVHGASARRRCGHLRERPAHARCRRTRSLRGRSARTLAPSERAEASNQPVGALGVVPRMRRRDAVAEARSPGKAEVVVSMISKLVGGVSRRQHRGSIRCCAACGGRCRRSW